MSHTKRQARLDRDAALIREAIRDARPPRDGDVPPPAAWWDRDQTGGMD